MENKEARTRPRLDRAGSVPRTVLTAISPPYDSELDLHFYIDLRAVGRLFVCANSHYAIGNEGGQNRRTSRAAIVLWNGTPGLGHHYWRGTDTLALRTPWAKVDARIVLRDDVRFHRVQFRPGVLL